MLCVPRVGGAPFESRAAMAVARARAGGASRSFSARVLPATDGDGSGWEVERRRSLDAPSLIASKNSKEELLDGGSGSDGPADGPYDESIEGTVYICCISKSKRE